MCVRVTLKARASRAGVQMDCFFLGCRLGLLRVTEFMVMIESEILKQILQNQALMDARLQVLELKAEAAIALAIRILEMEAGDKESRIHQLVSDAYRHLVDLDPKHFDRISLQSGHPRISGVRTPGGGLAI